MKLLVGVAVALIAVAPLVLLGVSPSRRPQVNPSSISTPSTAPVETPIPAPPPPPSPAEIVAKLPAGIGGLKEFLPDWVKLEAALISDPDFVLPLLLDRYAREADPAYKGLLAVLLSTHPSTHHRILEDFKSSGPGDGELFQGMALFALVAPRKPPRDHCGAPFWPRLVDLMDFASKEMALKRRILNAPGDGEAHRLLDELLGIRRWRSGDIEIGSFSSLDRDKVVRDAAGATRDPDVRSTLLAALDRKWEWSVVSDVARWALWRSAKADREFAGTLVREFMDRQDRDNMLKGFDLLIRAELPAEQVATVANIARNSLTDPKVFTESVELLGHQKGAEPEAILMDLYALTRNRDDFKESVLTAMTSHLGASFEPVARMELTSSSPAVRMRALELLAEINPAASVEPVVQAFIADPDPEVRKSALSILVTANRWTSREEGALRSVAESDPHPRMREMARLLRDAEDREDVSWWMDLEIEDLAD